MAAGDSRHADLEDPVGLDTAWLWDCTRAAPKIAGVPVRPGGRALSGAASPGESRVGWRRLGSERSQSPRQVLPVDRAWQAQARDAVFRLAADVERHPPGDRGRRAQCRDRAVDMNPASAFGDDSLDAGSTSRFAREIEE